MASGGEPSFHLIGFLACVGATAARAFKSVLQSVLMSHSTEKLDSMVRPLCAAARTLQRARASLFAVLQAPCGCLVCSLCKDPERDLTYTHYPLLQALRCATSVQGG